MANKARCRVVQKYTGGNYEQRMRNFKKLLEIFRKTVKQSGILTEYKRKQAYEKPSEKRKRKNRENKERISKQNQDRNYYGD